jgi:hypothetical protein
MDAYSRTLFPYCGCQNVKGGVGPQFPPWCLGPTLNLLVLLRTQRTFPARERTAIAKAKLIPTNQAYLHILRNTTLTQQSSEYEPHGSFRRTDAGARVVTRLAGVRRVPSGMLRRFEARRGRGYSSSTGVRRVPSGMLRRFDVVRAPSAAAAGTKRASPLCWSSQGGTPPHYTLLAQLRPASCEFTQRIKPMGCLQVKSGEVNGRVSR